MHCYNKEITYQTQNFLTFCAMFRLFWSKLRGYSVKALVVACGDLVTIETSQKTARSLCRNHDYQRMSFILFVLTEEHLLNVSPHSRQVAHMHSAWRSLIHVILWQNVSCLGRTQCASIPIQFRDRRRSLSCTTGPWSLWGLVEQMVSFSTSIWPSSPFFFFFFFLFPKGLREESASGRWLWRRVAVWYISLKTCCLKASAVGVGWGGVVLWCIACWCQNISRIIKVEHGLRFS